VAIITKASVICRVNIKVSYLILELIIELMVNKFVHVAGLNTYEMAEISNRRPKTLIEIVLFEKI
jgi:hypothetical protein